MTNINETRLMARLFSATEEGDAELTEQVGNDIETAKRTGSVDTPEITYVNLGEGKVCITDKENGEQTIAEQAEDGNYDLYPAEMSHQIEGYSHPGMDGVTPGQQQGAADEYVESHMNGQGVIAPNQPNGGLNPMAGHEKSVAETAAEGPAGNCADGSCECEEDDEKQFSVSTDNTVVQRIFCDQEFCERVFSEVIESEDTAKVGNLKIEKVEDNAVVVTDQESGDQAKVTLKNDNMEVTELDSKNFSEEEYEEERIYSTGDSELDELMERAFCDGYEFFQEELQREFSEEDEEGDYEDEEGEDEEGGEYEGEDDDESDYGGPGNFDALHVVGVDTFNHQIVDSEEYSEESAQELAARLQEIGVDAVQIFNSPEQARDYAMNLLNNLGVQSEEQVDEPEQAEFSDHDIWITRYFSDNTVCADRLFSETCNDINETQNLIEEAIATGERTYSENETFIPISENEAIIEDREFSEYTYVSLGDDYMNCETIDQEEARNFCEVEEEDRYFSEDGDYYEEERIYSTGDEELDELMERAFCDGYEYFQNELQREFSEEDEEIYSNEEETKFFSEHEEMNDYMTRLFSGDADEKEIEDAIENGNQVENDNEVITPVDATTAIIEDKKSGEFTKAVMDDDKLDINPISEEEADKLTEGLSVETKSEEGEKKFSDPVLDKFFADIQGPQPAGPNPNEIIPAIMDPATGQLVPADQAAPDASQGAPAGSPQTVEAVEDKAMAAVQSIQAAAAEAEAAILNAKAAPAEGQMAELQEAQFSSDYAEDEQRLFSDNDNLISWLEYK